MPPTPTCLPLRQTPRRPVLSPRTPLQTCPVYRRTFAGWPTVVSAQNLFLLFIKENAFFFVASSFHDNSVHIIAVFISVPGICFAPVHSTLKSAFSSLVAERDRMRHTIDMQAPQPVQVLGLKTAYASVSYSCDPQRSVLHHCTTRTYIIPIKPSSCHLNRNVQAAPTPWSTRYPMRAKHLSQSRYRSSLMRRSTCSPPPPLRSDSILCLVLLQILHL